MSKNILEQIIKQKSQKVNRLKKTLQISSLQNIIDKNDSFINFKKKLKKTSIIKKFQ